MCLTPLRKSVVSNQWSFVIRHFHMLLSETEIRSICDQLLRLSKADDMEVSVESEDYSHLRFAANGFTTSGRREDLSASITVWIGGKRGSASAHDLDRASLRSAVE